jgi:nicotinamide-nucleotide amidase
MIRAELLAVGTELLLGQILDTNSAYLARKLAEIGIGVAWHSTVGDNVDDIAASVRLAAQRADAVVIMGGLGPTIDDVTAEGVAQALGRPLERDPESERAIAERLSRRNIAVLPSHLKQAMLPRGSRPLPNDVGIAPGFVLEEQGKVIAALPGVPSEMKAMAENSVLPLLKERAGAGAIVWRVLRFAGTGETIIQERIADLLPATNPSVAFLPKAGSVDVRLTAHARDAAEANRLIHELHEKIVQRAGEFYLGADEEGLESVVGRMLREAGMTLAVAESCTGGLIGHMITQVPGSSDYFLMGVTAYSDEAKVKVLGVPEDMIRAHGAVSSQAAEAMARGVRNLAGSSIGVSVTGIAGPGGATPTKPVGLVYTALATESGITCREHRFGSTREDIKRRSAIAALIMVKDELAARKRDKCASSSP